MCYTSDMSDVIQEMLDRIVETAKRDEQVLAIVLFGSASRGEGSATSDLDVCLVLEPNGYTPLDLSEKKLEYLAAFDGDIQVFQQLPIYMKQRVLRDGKVLFCRDEDTLYQLAFDVIREYSDYEHIYREYLVEVANVG
jgi:predicted nucleotidyltransferase